MMGQEEDHNTLISERIALAKERNALASERTRFSAERTVSAWMRTGLASIGAGFAIVRLLEFKEINHRLIADTVGEVLMIWGIFIFFLALIDYNASCKKFGSVANRRNRWWITLTMIIFAIASLFLFFVSSRN